MADATPLKILALSGSLRKGSFNTMLLHAAKEVAPAGMSIDIYDLAPIPMYNDDIRTGPGYPPVVQDFRRAIADRPVPTALGALAVTCSIGVAAYDNAMPPEELIRRADEALYRAKRLGRNCVCTENSCPESEVR